MNHSRCPDCGIGQDQIAVSRPYPIRPSLIGADHICLLCGFGWREHIPVNDDQYQLVLDASFDVRSKISQERIDANYEQSLEDE